MRRAPLIAGLLVVVVVLGWLGYGTRNKPEAPTLAALPTAVPSSVPSARLDPVVADEVQAAVPAAVSAAPVVADVSPTPSKVVPALPAPAKPSAPARAIEPAPVGPRYTYFGGRR